MCNSYPQTPSGRGIESKSDTWHEISGIEKELRYLVVGCVLGWVLVESEVLVGPSCRCCFGALAFGIN